jgi:outer membrane protein assembly factor BamB
MGSASKSLCTSLCLFVCVVLTSCNGGGSQPPGDFALSSTPASISLVAGGAAQQISVNAVPTYGFMGMVSVAVTGLPSGVTVQPATLTLTPGTAQSLTLTATAAAAASTTMFTLTGTSGALTHSATTAITITPAPDYTLTVSPASLTIVSGATGSPVTVTVNPANSFSGTVSVAITGLPTGVTANPATLSVVPGTPQSTTLTAALSTAAAATSTVTFTGTSGSLVHAASLTLTTQPPPLTAAPDVTTYHYDVARDGLNAQETILTQANVNSTQFGKIGFDTVDGKVDAEPLYLANLIVGGQLHNVLFVATEHGSVYAFDADSGTQLWMASVIASGEMTSDNHNCSQITTEIGITSTPVIDRKQGPNGTIFTVTMSKDASGAYHHRLHALDITTGAEISGSPTEITASYPGTGTTLRTATSSSIHLSTRSAQRCSFSMATSTRHLPRTATSASIPDG